MSPDVCAGERVSPSAGLSASPQYAPANNPQPSKFRHMCRSFNRHRIQIGLLSAVLLLFLAYDLGAFAGWLGPPDLLPGEGVWLVGSGDSLRLLVVGGVLSLLLPIASPVIASVITFSNVSRSFAPRPRGELGRTAKLRHQLTGLSVRLSRRQDSPPASAAPLAFSPRSGFRAGR